VTIDFRILSVKAIVFASVMLVGCGGEDAFNVGGCNPANTPTNITSFSVVGSTTDSGTEVINSSDDFTLSWDLNSSCTYTYQLFLAPNNTQSDIFDISLDAGTCGHGLSCTYQVDVNCSFDAMGKTMTCNGGTPVDVSTLLPDPSPRNVYLILEASNEMMDSDVMASSQVRVDF